MTADLITTWLRAQLDWQEDIARRARDADEAAVRLFAGHCSPNWTLREVEAKRRIVDLHAKPHECPVWDLALGETCTAYVGGYECPTLLLLALPYADRPGYRDEWRP